MEHPATHQDNAENSAMIATSRLLAGARGQGPKAQARPQGADAAEDCADAAIAFALTLVNHARSARRGRGRRRSVG